MYHGEVLYVFKRTDPVERYLGERCSRKTKKKKKWSAKAVTGEMLGWSGKSVWEQKPEPEKKDLKLPYALKITHLMKKKSSMSGRNNEFWFSASLSYVLFPISNKGWGY